MLELAKIFWTFSRHTAVGPFLSKTLVTNISGILKIETLLGILKSLEFTKNGFIDVQNFGFSHVMIVTFRKVLIGSVSPRPLGRKHDANMKRIRNGFPDWGS